MLRTVTTRCELNKEEADALNHASGLIYTQVMVTHWRACRHSNHWISAGTAEKLNDWQNKDTPRVLQAHSIDAAQQGFHLWHIVVEDGHEPVPVENGATAAIDLGEIHPVAITNGEEVCILSCRELRSITQQTHKELEHLAKQLSRCTRGSRRSRRLKSARRKMLARQKRRRRIWKRRPG